MSMMQLQESTPRRIGEGRRAFFHHSGESQDEVVKSFNRFLIDLKFTIVGAEATGKISADLAVFFYPTKCELVQPNGLFVVPEVLASVKAKAPTDDVTPAVVEVMEEPIEQPLIFVVCLVQEELLRVNWRSRDALLAQPIQLVRSLDAVQSAVIEWEVRRYPYRG